LSALLFEPHLKPPFATFSNRFGNQILFLLERHVNYAPLSRVKNTERKGNTVFPDMTGGEFRHRMELGFAGLPKSFRVDNEPVLPIKASTHYLKQQNFESIKQLSILRKGKARIGAAKIKKTTFVSPLGRHLEVETYTGNDLCQEFFSALTSFVHNNRPFKRC
jgi:hypothetical protein